MNIYPVSTGWCYEPDRLCETILVVFHKVLSKSGKNRVAMYSALQKDNLGYKCNVKMFGFML